MQVKDTPLLELVFHPPLSPKVDYNQHVERMFGQMQSSDLNNGLGESVTLGGDASVANARHITVRFKQENLDEVIKDLRAQDVVAREHQFLHSTYERVEALLLEGVNPKLLLASLAAANEQWKKAAAGAMPTAPAESQMSGASSKAALSNTSRLNNFKAELHANIRSLITQQGSHPSGVLDEVQLVMDNLGEAISTSKSKGGTVMQHWAELTRRPIPLGQGTQRF